MPISKHIAVIRDKIYAGAHEPVCPPGLNRYQVKSALTIPLPRGQASKRNQQECKERLPKLS